MLGLLMPFQKWFSQRTWKTLPNRTHERKHRKRLIRFDADIEAYLEELEKEKKEIKTQVRNDDLPF